MIHKQKFKLSTSIVWSRACKCLSLSSSGNLMQMLVIFMQFCRFSSKLLCIYITHYTYYICLYITYILYVIYYIIWIYYIMFYFMNCMRLLNTRALFLDFISKHVLGKQEDENLPYDLSNFSPIHIKANYPFDW